FFVFVLAKVGILLDESFSRRPKIELLGMIAEEFAIDPSPNEAAVSVDVHFGHAEFRGGQILFFIHAASRRIEFSTGGIDAVDFRFRNARRAVHDDWGGGKASLLHLVANSLNHIKVERLLPFKLVAPWLVPIAAASESHFVCLINSTASSGLVRQAWPSSTLMSSSTPPSLPSS